MNDHSLYSRRALLTLGTLTILAPALRLFPTGATEAAGRATWLSSLAAIPMVLLYIFFLSSLMEQRQDGENLQDLILRVCGKVGGRIALAVMSAWMILYAGFVLRSGSERLILTVYPNSTPGGFSVVMALVSLAAVLGSARSIVRAARIILPVVMGALLLVLFFSLLSVKSENLLPITVYDTLPVLKGSLAAVDIISVGAYSLCFFEGGVKGSNGRKKDFAMWSIGISLLLTLLIVAIIGSMGAEVTSMLSRPFFVLVRNLVFFRTVERVEALVVMLWIFPDFLQVSLFLFAAQYSLRLLFGKRPALHGEKPLSLTEGRWLIWLCSAAATLCSLFIAPDSPSMRLWSQELIPALNLSFAFIFLPIIYIVGKARKAL